MKKVYRAKKVWVYDYEITVTNYKDDALKIYVFNHQFDSHDYAFVKKNNMNLEGLYSYSSTAVEYVKRACIAANVFEQLKNA